MRNLLIGFFLLLGFQLRAADFYWVGGAGSWSDIGHWSKTSGGPANQSIIPNLNDDVHFDANSGFTNTTNVDLPTSSPAYCRNMTWAGVTVTARLIYRGQPLYIYGSVELAASAYYGTQGLNFVGSSAATLKMNGAGRYPAAGWYNPISVNKPGSSLTLLDGIPDALVVTTVTLTAGTLDMSDFTHTITDFAGNTTNTRSLDISNATIIVRDSWDYRGTNNTVNTTNSNITVQRFFSDRFSFPKVDVTSAGSTSMAINNTTFGELTFTSTLSPSQTVRIGAGNTIDRLEYKGGGSIAGGGNTIKDLFIAPSNPGFSFVGNNTITGSLHANTPDCNALSQILGYGTGATITFGPGATVDVRNILMTNLAAAGSVTLPITVTGADGGGNTGWDFQPRATGTTLYWVGGSGDWNDKGHWSASSGGAGGYCVPFTGDNVVFDANSGFTAGNNTVTATAGTAWCHNMTWANLTGSPVFDNRGAYLYIYGSLALDPTLTMYGNMSFKGTEASTLTANGFNLGTPVFRVERTGTYGGITLADNITHTGFRIFHNTGKLLLPNRTMHISQLSTEASGVRTLDISNSTITLEYEWLNNSSNNTWVNNGAGSFIVAKSRFVTSGLTYPNVQIDGTGNSVNIVNANITDLLFTNTGLTFGTIALNGGNTIGTVEFKGAAEIRGNNTITNLLLAPSRNYNFRNTQTINGIFRYNNPDCSGLGEMRGLGGGATLNFGPSSTKDVQNVLLQNMAATGTGVPVTVTGADAGGNSGFNITATASGARYWVGGSGDWNDAAHWSTTSGGPGGACIPTVSNDVFFNASSFSSGSSAVTINQGHAYCRNMDWTGAAFAPTFTKNGSFNLEIWGSLVMNPAVTMNTGFNLGGPSVLFTGAANSTITSNGAELGNFDFSINKPDGFKVTFTDNFKNALTNIDVRSGSLDLSGRTVTMGYITDDGSTALIDLNITNATINGGWHAFGASTSVQAAGSTIVGSIFRVNKGTYNKVEVTGANNNDPDISNATIDKLLFSNTSTASQAWIRGNNTINRLEFKGKGYIQATGNSIDTLIFAPGKIYTFQAGTNTTINEAWYGSGTPCNPTQIVSSSTTANATVTKTAGSVDFDYIRLNRITAAGVTPFKAGEHTVDLGGNVNWAITPYNGTATITGLGSDKLLLASEFPYTIRTDGFFASPLAQFQWKNGATVVGTGSELVVTGPGTYSVNVTYPDGCSSSDQIVITQAAADLSVVNAVDKPTPAIGSQVVFTITATNNGPQQSGGITVTDLLPAGYTFKSATPALGTYNPATGLWTIGTLASGANSTLTITAIAMATGPYGTTATIAGAETDPVPANNSSSTGTTPAPSALSIVKTTDAAEPGTNGLFTISLPAGVTISEPITVAYNITGTATAGTDYTTIPATAVILAGQNSVTLPVTAMNETLIEPTETVIVTLTGGTSTNFTFAASSTNTATVNIADDDNTPANRTISVTALVATVTEPASTRFVISLPTGITASENITVTYNMSGTATSGLDYQALSGTATILAGTNTVEVIENTLDDALLESTETAIMTLSGATTATLGNFVVSTTPATLNIADDDNGSAANRVLSITKTTDAAEPGTNGGFKISLPTGVVSSANITVAYTIDASSTASGTDYQLISGAIAIPAGQNSVTVPVSVIDNNIIEPTETVIMNISGGSDGSNTYTANAGANSATVNITDNDFAGNSNIVLLTKVSDAIEGGIPGQYRVSLPPGVTSSQDVVITFNMAGSAIRPADYSLSIPGNIIIPADANEVFIDVNAVADGAVEGPETVVLNLTGATSGSLPFTIDATSNGAVVSIVDANAASSTPLQVITGTNAIEPSSNGSFTVKLAGVATSTLPITVGYSISGTATSGVDYQALGTLIIPANTNSINVPLVVLDDQVIEPTEQMTFRILSGSANAFIFPPDPANDDITVNIADNDAAVAGNRVLSIVKTTDAAEPGTNGSFTVSLPAGYTSAKDITMAYTRSGTATNATDYTVSTVTLPAYSNSITIPVNVVADIVTEPTEMVTLTLNNSTDGNAFTYTPSSSNNAATVNITDGNAADRIVRVTSSANVNEAFSFPGSVNINIGVIASEDVTVTYTLGGTATPGTDYTGYTGTFILPAGTQGLLHQYTALPDKIIEGTETIIFTVTGATTPSGLTYTPDPSSSIVTPRITDDDNTPANRVLSITKNTDAAEPSTAGSFTISLPTGVTSVEDVTANYTIAGTATAGTDYTALSGTIVIPAGQNSVPLPVTVLDDQLIEGNETIIATITGGTTPTLGSFTTSSTSGSATMTITDDDDTPANRTLSIVKTLDGTEPATNGTFKISLPTGILPSEDITVNYTVSGTATAGIDYTALSGNLTILAGQNGTTLTVPVLNDAVYDDLETVIITLNGGTSANFTYTGNGYATVNITDDEPIPPTITSFTPPSGVAGTVVNITGTNFTGATTLTFNGTFATFVVNSATSITATVGVGTTTGLITVITPAGTATSLTNFTILNTQPLVAADSYTTPLNIPYTDNVFNNDADPDGNTLIASLVTAPAHGTVVLNADGSFTYTPNANYAGTDSFQYRACDNGSPSLCNTALVTINVENTPSPEIVNVTSIDADGTYKLGDVITIVATFNQNVTVAGGVPNLLLDVTTPGSSAQYVSGSGTNTLTFQYTVQPGDQSTDLEYDLSSLLGLNGATIHNASNLDAVLTLPATGPNSLGGSKNLVIDGIIPVIVAVNVPTAATYVAGQNLDFVINYSEPVTVNTTGGTPRLAITLDNGGTVYATYLSGSGTGAHVYRLITTTGQEDLNGITLASAIDLNGGTQPDASGNSASLALNNVASTSAVLVDAISPVVVSINRADPNPATGNSVTFTVTFSEAVTGVDINDFSLVSTATAAGNITNIVPVSPSAYTVTINNITGGGTLGLDLKAAGTGIADLAGNPISTGFTGEVYTINLAADLSITKTIDNASPLVGGSVVFTLIAANNGLSNGTGVIVTDLLPAGYTYVSSTPPVGTTYNSATGVWTISTLANAASSTLTITATVNATGPYANTAIISGTESDPVPANNTSVVTPIPVPVADLSVVKTVDTANPSKGSNIVFTLVATNNGPSGGTGVSVTDLLPAGYTYVSSTLPAGTTYNPATGVWSIGALANAASSTLTITARVNGAGLYSNAASISGTENDPVPANNISAVTPVPVPGNLALSITKTADAAEPGINGSFLISLPAGVTIAEDVTVNYTISGTATSGSDYTTLSGTVTIPAEQNSVSIPVTVTNDNILEATETVIVTLNGGTSTNFAFTGTGNAAANIADDESTVPANLALSINKGTDGAESGSNASFIIGIPAGLTTAADITANYNISGTATSGADYAPLTGSVTIPAGQSSVTVPVTVSNDQIIEATETLTLTLAGGNSGSLTFTGTGSATANITDDDSSPQGLTLSIVKTADAAEPATNGSFSISLPAGLTAAENITVNYTVSGTATATADYVAFTGSAVITAGQNAVTLPLRVTDDNVPEATETLTLTLTGGTSASLTFAGTGNATANLTDDDKRGQVITFTALPVKTFGDPAFTLSATGGASGNPVTYTSSDPAVATVSGNTVTIVGAGTATITASQAGNTSYNAAAAVSQVLTVLVRPNTAPTLAVIDDQRVCYTIAAQTVALSGITAGTEPGQSLSLSVSSNNPGLFSALSVTQPTGTNASLNYTINGSAGGTAVITVTVKDNGGTINGGTDTFSRSFTLVASALPQLVIAADPGTNISKGQTIALTASGAASYSWANASGILGGQNSATLTVRPAQTTTYTVTGTSVAGCTSTQEITITVNEDYNLVANNVLTPNGDGKNDFFTVKNIDMYPNNELRIFDRAGRSVYSKRGYNNEWDGTLNGSPLDEDTYYYIIDFGNGVKAKKGFISIVRKY